MNKIDIHMKWLHSRSQLFSMIFKYFVQTVGHAFIWSKDTEVLVFFIQFEDVADVSAKFDHILSFLFCQAVLQYRNRGSPKTKIFQAKNPPFACGLAPRRAFPLGASSASSGIRASVFIKQFLRTIANPSGTQS